MNEEIYDVAVIGAGIVGSATAYHLAKLSYKTLLLEQFTLPHSRGSSHGQTRITRKAYTKEHYAQMMPEAYQLWEELEKEASTQLFKKTGMLMFGSPESPGLANAERALQNIHSVYEKLNPDQLKARFPQFRMRAGYRGLLDPDAGILKAHRALVVFQKMFTERGGTLIDEVKVEKVVPGETVTLHTNNGQYRARSVVIATGPWASRLINPLGMHVPLQPVRVTVNYFREKNAGEYGADKFPCIIVERGDVVAESDLYGLPADEYPNCVKICVHTGPKIDPDERDAETGDNWDVKIVQKFVQEFCPTLNDKPSIIEKCIYTMTPDEDFVIDTHPYWKNIVVGVGFSGHGFKLAPVTGKLLAELATGRHTSYDLTPFRAERFLKPTSHL